MRLYLAGNVNFEIEEAFWGIGARYRLFSYAEIDKIGKGVLEYWMDREPPFLDSGAFGAFTRGAKIDVLEYCQFIKSCKGRVAPVAGLDVIGDWRGSARNFDVMLAQGLHPMPTFHANSPDHELRRLLGLTDYLALGGVVGVHENDMRPWLDKCFRTIKDFWPKKIHVFGVMAQWALERYPFYSADSSSAVVGGGMGRVMTFDKGKIASRGWVEYARETLNGDIMDGVTVTRPGIKGSAHFSRRVFNAQTQLRLQRHVTDIWTMRGITWEEPCAASSAPSVTSTPTS